MQNTANGYLTASGDIGTAILCVQDGWHDELLRVPCELSLRGVDNQGTSIAVILANGRA